MSDSDDRPDWVQVARDQRLIEDVRHGAQPPTGDEVGDRMARWRDEVRDEPTSPLFDEVADRHPNIVFPSGKGDQGQRGDEPATSWFTPHDHRIDYGDHADWSRPAEPVAATAGEQDHSDPWRYASPHADPPENP